MIQNQHTIKREESRRARQMGRVGSGGKKKTHLHALDPAIQLGPCAVDHQRLQLRVEEGL